MFMDWIVRLINEHANLGRALNVVSDLAMINSKKRPLTLIEQDDATSLLNVAATLDTKVSDAKNGSITARRVRVLIMAFAFHCIEITRVDVWRTSTTESSVNFFEREHKC